MQFRNRQNEDCSSTIKVDALTVRCGLHGCMSIGVWRYLELAIKKVSHLSFCCVAKRIYMDTLSVIVLTSIFVGFFYRAKKLKEDINGVYDYEGISDDKTPSEIQYIQVISGCFGCLYFPFFAMSFITTIYLLFKVDWWILVVGITLGMTIVNLLGYMLERLFELPNHEKINTGCGYMLNLNSSALRTNNKLYKKAMGIFFFYNMVSFVIAIILIISVE